MTLSAQAYRPDQPFTFSYYFIKFDFLYVDNSNQLRIYHHRLSSIIMTQPLVITSGSIVNQANLGSFERECKAADYPLFCTEPSHTMTGSNDVMIYLAMLSPH